MDDASRRWVLKSLSPPLHPRDLRSTTGPSRSQDDFSAPDGPALRARPLAVSPDGCDERHPDSPDGSSGSRDGFYSLVEDPMSPEAELNEAWMLSPQRRLHLTTLKEDRAFKVQSYAGGKKTESLFRDSESRYQVRPESRRRAFGEEEEKQLRKEIIRKQAPKKKSTFKPSERLGVPEKPDWSRPPNTLTKGFGVSDGPVAPDPACPVGPGAIDGAQINFGAARQQFLDLEQGKRDVLVPPWRSRVSRKMEGEDATRSQCGKVETFAENERLSGPSGVLADLGSLAAENLPAEACPCSVGGEDVFEDGVPQTAGKAKSDDHDETPIEKEIRLVREREQNLRRARGLKHGDGFSELVEIQSGRVQSLPSPREAQKKSHGSFALQLESHEKNVSCKAPEEDRELLLSPRCPHRHAEETSSTLSPTTPPPPRRVPSWTTTLSWRSNQESAGLERRKKSAPDFIEKEIEEALRRERELRESRRSGQSTEPTGEFRESGLRSATPLAERASKVTVTQVDPIERSGPTGAPPSDSEEPRERRKVEDGSYAGIRPVDDINDQVVESTRVIRHKSRRALRWEAGVFANQLQH